MAISTRIAPMYAGQKLFTAILCAVFGLWGAYDYFVKIPQMEARYAEFEQTSERLKELTQLHVQGQPLTAAQQQEFAAATAKLVELSPGGASPKKTNKWDRPIQLVYIACLPFAPWFFIMFLRAKRQRYTLDDHGALHFAGDKEHQSGVWQADEIVDIDMSRWMAKSIAFAIHKDGRRLMLDAYIHKNLHLIVGALASQFYPEQWDAEAKLVKSDEDDEDESPLGEEDESMEQQAGAEADSRLS